jgi:GT2 family glycosyltransferase
MNTNYLIILLNYNNWQDTIECIKSLENSCVKSSNILVIENCSTDESVEQLKNETPGIKLIQAEKNLGFTGGNNLGIKYAYVNKYDYAIVLNNDTIIESKDSIPLLIKEMDENSDITLGTGRIFYYPEKNKIWYDGGKVSKWRCAGVHYNFNREKKEVILNNRNDSIDFISGCYMCIRLKDIPVLGYMEEKLFIYLDDLEYCIRAAKRNLKFIYIPDAIIYHKARGRGTHTPRMIYYVIRNRRIVINQYFGILTKIYFEMVLVIKRLYWFITNKRNFHILKRALRDYRENYFGQAPDKIN